MGTLKAAPGPHSIHLCVDMQRLFGDSGPWPTPWMSRVLPTVERLVARAPERTVFTRFIPPERPENATVCGGLITRNGRRSPATRWTGRCFGWFPNLKLSFPPPPAHVIDKPAHSAFAASALQSYLAEKNVDTVLITGSETDFCVLATILSAVDLGYRTIVVKDGLYSSSDTAHDASLRLYARRFNVQVELTEAAELIDSWRPDL